MRKATLSPPPFAPACRRVAATALVLALALGAPGAARSESCDSLAGRTLTWIVPLSPGGGFDLEARTVAPHLSRTLGADVVVVNMPGAGGQIGAKAIRDARPDGTTFGVVQGVGLIATTLVEEPDAPRFEEFTILGRSATQRHVWMVAGDSPLEGVGDLLERGAAGELVFGATDLAGSSFLGAVLPGSQLGIEPDLVVGYRGSAELRLAVLRGEVDAMSGTYDSSYGLLESGEFRAVLQVSSASISDDAVLAGVPTLGGPDGLAVQHALASGGDPAAAEAAASLAAEMVGLGRYLVAPLHLPEDVEQCLTDAVAMTLADPATLADIAAARLRLEPLAAGPAAELARDTLARAGVFRPLVNKAIARVRS